MIEELEDAMGVGEAYWRLSFTEEGTIHQSSYIERFLHYAASFFTSGHTQALCDRLLTVIQEQNEESSAFKIVCEKMAKIRRHAPHIWWHALPEKGSVVSLLASKEGMLTFPHQITPFKEGGRYYNYPGESIWSQFLETLRLLFVGMRGPVTDLENVNETLRAPSPSVSRHDGKDPLITWVGHATVLIQLEGFNLLFDPSFGFVSPCFQRHTKPGISFEQLPLIDVLALSHNHGDHINRVEDFAPYQPVLLAGSGSKDWLQGMEFERIEELSWWEQLRLSRAGKELKITAIPAQHGSQTGIRDINQMLWCGYIIEVGDHTLYFSGDTALGNDLVDEHLQKQRLFEQIKKQFSPISIAFLPIAPQGEEGMHLNEEQAFEAFKILEADEMIPIHWGTYRMGAEKIEEPIEKLRRLVGDDLALLKMGEPFLYQKKEATQASA